VRAHYETGIETRPTGKLPPAPVQRAEVGAVEVTFDGQRVRISSGGRVLAEESPRGWKEARLVRGTLRCEYHPLISQLALDSAGQRLLFEIHNVILTAGDSCAVPERYAVIAWSKNERP